MEVFFFLFLKEQNTWARIRSGWDSPARHKGHVDSPITPGHIVAKEIGAVDTEHNLWPCREITGVREGKWGSGCRAGAPSALTAKRVGALEGDVDGEVPDQSGGGDAALGGDLGDSLLQALQGMWGEPGGAGGEGGDRETGWGQGHRGCTAVGTQSWP